MTSPSTRLCVKFEPLRLAAINFVSPPRRMLAGASSVIACNMALQQLIQARLIVEITLLQRCPASSTRRADSRIVRESALISELAGAVVTEIVANALAAASFALAALLATPLWAVSREMRTTAIEAVHTLAAALALAFCGAVAGNVIAAAIPAAAILATLLALALALATLGAVPREVVAAAIEA
eukprot:CAMPEP_0181400136 /NCGR_PEP_ID=MMETSP1110-20121109/1958_1 /TAXON_ID=174948 /ORGANISM="Symbiodinium sp., Strain CCMP421" /LENGTH=183 /DNA_ID=CAMNT_0023522223 /DNA_START=35 /DNA_END=582 /DNA_ORIENTATION=-